MSPHVEYWGIPSPTEEFYRTPETNIALDKGETALAGNSQLFELNIEYTRKTRISSLSRSDSFVSFSKCEWRLPDRFIK